jgi:hypothetical protein
MVESFWTCHGEIILTIPDYMKTGPGARPFGTMLFLPRSVWKKNVKVWFFQTRNSRPERSQVNLLRMSPHSPHFITPSRGLVESGDLSRHCLNFS